MKKTSAFSLVEIALAMGVTSFSLVAVMGLLSVALGSSKSSTDDTLLASMVKDIAGNLRRQQFTAAQTYATSSPIAYFDESGRRLMDSSGNDLSRPVALSSGAIYQCTQTAQADTGTLSASGSANMLRIKLSFAWPAQATHPPNTKVVNASIANY